MRSRNVFISAASSIALCLAPHTLHAQFVGASPANHLQNVSVIKPPAGSKVAIVVFEDLACPFCAKAHPVESEAAAKAHVPLLRYDFPLQQHVWTFQGAVCARYIQKKLSPSLANSFRSDLFAAQRLIENKDDLQRFTQTWLQQHGHQMPFVIDPDGSLAKAVQADFDLGRTINVQYTPTVLVIANDKYQVVCGTKDGPNDPAEILPVVEAALADARAAHPSSHPPSHALPATTAEPQ